MGNVITYAVNWERCEEERKYIFIHRCAMCFGMVLGWKTSHFLKKYGGTVQQEKRGKQIVIYQPIIKKGFWQLEKGRLPVDYYQRWTIKLNLHFRCAPMYGKYNMGANVKRDFSEWLVESVSLLGSTISQWLASWAHLWTRGIL